MLLGRGNKAIATKLRIPVSTVQRRNRESLERQIIRVRYELDHRRIGFRTGLIHVYLNDGSMQAIADQISKKRGMESASVYIGNSDIVGLFVFRETQHLLDIISECKKIDGVERVVWSEVLPVVLMAAFEVSLVEFEKLFPVAESRRNTSKALPYGQTCVHCK